MRGRSSGSRPSSVATPPWKRLGRPLRGEKPLHKRRSRDPRLVLPRTSGRSNGSKRSSGVTHRQKRRGWLRRARRNRLQWWRNRRIRGTTGLSSGTKPSTVDTHPVRRPGERPGDDLNAARTSAMASPARRKPRSCFFLLLNRCVTGSRMVPTFDLGPIWSSCATIR